jgi:protein O-GlcNAc transferase
MQRRPEHHESDEAHSVTAPIPESPFTPAAVKLANRALEALNGGDAPRALQFINDLQEEAGAEGPEAALVYHLIGLVSLYVDQTSRAVEAFETAHRLAPDMRDYVEALAAIYARLGRVVDALYYGKIAVTAKRRVGIPGALPAWLGSFEQHFYRIEDQPLRRLGDKAALRQDWAGAAKYYHQALDLDREDATAWRGLAEMLRRLGRAHESLDAMIELHRVVPDDINDIAALGDTMRLVGAWDQALDCQRHAASRRPTDVELAWWPVRTLLEMPGTPRSAAAAAMTAWGAEAARIIPPIENRPPAEPMTAARKLRLGVVSSCWADEDRLDLIVPVLNALPRHTVELHAYADGYARTSLGSRLQSAAFSWQEIGELDDETTAYILANDQLDALIDLDGPQRRRRHGLFLRKPVSLMLSLMDLPEAATACGFDAVLGDDDTHPETAGPGPVIRVAGVGASLPADLVLLTQKIEHQPVPGLTLGFLAGPGRIGSETVLLWSRILAARPDAVLLLSPVCLGGARGVAAVTAAFQEAGIGHRLEVDSAETELGYLQRLDLLLDPPGAVATEKLIIRAAADIPVVTLPGALPQTRLLGGWLRRLGLDAWIARDADSYVSAALAAAEPTARGLLHAAVARECADGVRRRALELETALRRYISMEGAR